MPNTRVKKVLQVVQNAEASAGVSVDNKVVKRAIKNARIQAYANEDYPEPRTLVWDQFDNSGTLSVSLEMIQPINSLRVICEACYTHMNMVVPNTQVDPIHVLTYLYWLAVQCFTSNGCFKTSLYGDYPGSPGQIDESQIRAADLALHVPNMLLYWIHHFMPYRTPEGNEIRYNMYLPFPTPLNSGIGGDLTGQTLAAQVNPWGSRSGDWNIAQCGRAFFRLHETMGPPTEWYSTVSSGTTFTFEQIMGDIELHELIDSWIQTTKLSSPLQALANAIDPKAGKTYPFAPDGSAYAFTNNSGTSFPFGIGFSCPTSNYDPNVSLALGCINPQFGSGTSPTFTQINPKSATDNSLLMSFNANFGYAENHVLWFTHLANTTPFRLGGLATMVRNHTLYPGIKQTIPDIQYHDMTMMNHIVAAIERRLSQVASTSVFETVSQVQQYKVALQCAVYASAMESWPLAGLLETRGTTADVSAATYSRDFLKVKLPPLLAILASALGPIVTGGRFIVYALPCRVDTFNGSTPPYIPTSAASGFPLSIANSSVPVVGSNVPNQPNWFVDSFYPGIYATTTGWAPGVFQHQVNPQWGSANAWTAYYNQIESEGSIIDLSTTGLIQRFPAVTGCRNPLATPTALSGAYIEFAERFDNQLKNSSEAADFGTGSIWSTSQTILVFSTTSVVNIAVQTGTVTLYQYACVPKVECAGHEYPLSLEDRGWVLALSLRAFWGRQSVGEPAALRNAAEAYALFYSKNNGVAPFESILDSSITDTNTPTRFDTAIADHYDKAITAGFTDEFARVSAALAVFAGDIAKCVQDRRVPSTSVNRRVKSMMEMSYSYPYLVNTNMITKSATAPGGFNLFTWLASQVAKATTLVDKVPALISSVGGVIKSGKSVWNEALSFRSKGEDVLKARLGQLRVSYAHCAGDDELSCGAIVFTKTSQKRYTRPQLEELCGISRLAISSK
jgi:hypothetical protein